VDNDQFTLETNFEIKKSELPAYLRPPYGVKRTLARFDEREAAFYSSRFTTEIMGGINWRERMAAAATGKMLKNTPGYGQLDFAFSEASWRSYHPYDQSALMGWMDEPALRRPIEQGLRARGATWQGSAGQNSAILKQAARFFGAAAVGIAAVNQAWFYAIDREGLPIIFADGINQPEKNQECKLIPSHLNRIIVMLIAQDRVLAPFAPSALAGAAVGLGYSQMAETASKVAAMIRGLGYSAVPMGNDTSLSIPMAIDAGLGELGRHGLLINPDFGSLVRICKVLTDLPLEVDRPITFNTAEICRSCTICAESCPTRAISFQREATFDTVCPSNNGGIRRWPVDAWACLKFWANNGKDCGICQAVCPFSRTVPVGLKFNDPALWWSE
jgi:epoxyqueuosine reductase